MRGQWYNERKLQLKQRFINTDTILVFVIKSFQITCTKTFISTYFSLIVTNLKNLFKMRQFLYLLTITDFFRNYAFYVKNPHLRKVLICFLSHFVIFFLITWTETKSFIEISNWKFTNTSISLEEFVVSERQKKLQKLMLLIGSFFLIYKNLFSW